MYFLKRPSPPTIAAFIDAQSCTHFSYSEVGATNGNLPTNYTIDHNRIELGAGEEVFRRASSELQAWRMFDLGWSQLFQPMTPIEPGAVVAALFHHFGFWSLNACRVVYTINEDRRFGFAYGTLADHAEKGEERFSIEWSSDDSVFYDILAFSQPRHWTARMGKPIARVLQGKFVRDSKAVMVRSVAPDR